MWRAGSSALAASVRIRSEIGSSVPSWICLASPRWPSLLILRPHRNSLTTSMRGIGDHDEVELGAVGAVERFGGLEVEVVDEDGSPGGGRPQRSAPPVLVTQVSLAHG